MVKTLLICFVILAALTINGVGRTAPPVASTPAKALGKTTVLPLSEGRHLYDSGASTFWTPSTADLKKLEANLPLSIADYYRQYIGIVRDGKRLIFVNGFSTNVAHGFVGGKSDWHHHAVYVLDGGNAFFHATYDPKTRKFTAPVFNGLG